jgi:hypothetical protein
MFVYSFFDSEKQNSIVLCVMNSVAEALVTFPQGRHLSLVLVGYECCVRIENIGSPVRPSCHPSRKLLQEGPQIKYATQSLPRIETYHRVAIIVLLLLGE